MDAQELIRRARELAALADGATPGPWRWMYADTLLESADGRRTVLDHSMLCDECVQRSVDPSERDARLIEAAPEMAALLRQLADALEEATR